MSVCPRCGAENDPRNQYCFGCGAVLQNNHGRAENFNQEQGRPTRPQSRPQGYPQNGQQAQSQYRQQARPEYQQYQYDNYYKGDAIPQDEAIEPKKSTLSLIALIIGALASIYLISTASGSMSSTTNEWEALGASIAMSMVMPAVILVVAAAILNLIGWLTSNRVVTLISAICYLLGLLAFPMWGFVGIPSMILQFIAFSKMPKK